MSLFQRDWGVFVTLEEILEGWGGHQFPAKMENPGRWGVLSEIPSVVGVWIFSGTTQFPKLILYDIITLELYYGAPIFNTFNINLKNKPSLFPDN